MPICPLYTSCKYFCNLIKIVHFRAKHRISKSCKQTPPIEQKDSMCNKANIYNVLQDHTCFHFMFHTCDLVHVLSMGFILYKLFNMLNIFKILSGCLRRLEIVLLKRELVCSMIIISENATPKNLHKDESLV